MSDPMSVEIYARCGLPVIVLDAEHGMYGDAELFRAIQIVDLCGKEPWVRLGEINEQKIKQCLDAGARGLIFARVETDAQIYAIAKATGRKRGMGLVRRNLYGEKDLEHDKVKVIAQIESRDGVNLIQRQPGNLGFIDLFMLGPYDLSNDLGIPGQFYDKKYVDWLGMFDDALRPSKRGIHVVDGNKADVKRHIDARYGFIAVGLDTLAARETAEALAPKYLGDHQSRTS